MNNNQVVQIMIALSDGINPMTGEVYGKDSPYRDKDISAALIFAADTLSKQVKVTKYDEPMQLTIEDEILYEMLRSWRLRYSKRYDMRLYHIFSNESLRLISFYKPKDQEQLMKIKGVGTKKATKYGDDLFEVINARRHAV
ncbi:MAG: HRDC domain-containing protein [Vallitaleaceae bacterium]|jgi:superfamily II DNA helicase RecQ|nr:HRDC domain-containing protein [Vallitaleaceae bacterium]